MIEKCAISNINNNMQFIGLIILLLILCIVLLYYIKISSKTHNEIIEKYNNGNTQSSVNKSPYLNTSGRSPELQNTSDGHKDARYPTSNNAKISTATLRPCQIHFNDDGTSKYIYEDERTRTYMRHRHIISFFHYLKSKNMRLIYIKTFEV